MIKLHPRFVDAVRSASAPADLYESLQNAIELEHATIPTYLTGLYSLEPGENEAVREILKSIVIEEMLHMTIAANTLIAIGGSPEIDKPGFIPQFPGPLPMGIGDLTVSLAPFSLEQLKQYMKIELPEHPIDVPTVEAVAAGAEEYATIGEFYDAVIAKIEELGDGIFTGDPARQMVDNTWFPPDRLFAVTSVDTARRALTIIIREGEGTSTNPFDGEGEPAHYYRFEQIEAGGALVHRPGATPPYAFDKKNKPVVFDPAKVFPMETLAEGESYPEGSRSRIVTDLFDSAYTQLLRNLHDAFNGDPDHFGRAIGLMYQLRLLALDVVRTPNPSGSGTTGMTFRYQPLEPPLGAPFNSD